MTSTRIVWLRDDLRLADNPALRAAVDTGDDLVVVYVLDDESAEVRPLGAAARWWLHHSLAALDASLRDIGGSLVLRRGAAEEVIAALIAQTDAVAVHWNRRYGAARELDARLKTSLKDSGVEVTSYAANLLFEPWEVTTGQGEPFKVFTPFWRAALDRGVRRSALEAPSALRCHDIPSDALDDWGLVPTDPDWAAGFAEHHTPGEAAAHDRLEHFVHGVLENYGRRDEPGTEATSGLSPHLRFGEISPLQIWDRIHHGVPQAARRTVDKFLSEVGWREFHWSMLFQHPDIATVNYRREFDAFAWDSPDPRELRAWQQGRTGVPLVDAGMRELWATGTMHNRVRMVCASFLIKNLLVDWRIGEQWFWDCLVDADEASNPGNWQWVAGSGADAAPYFRVFNPVLQQQKFDPDLAYVRRWVPEYGTDAYPEPIVDLAATRKEALAHYDAMRRS